ncbi:MAG: TetR/AcrR family transcriptional regulator [Lachnospiraceae bacterium]|nr:TetR/AcrR family transcriptional regulator [Lachnospiraceae bacterium]
MNSETELSKKNVTRMNNVESNKITKECLQMALVALMQQKSYDRISISELVKKAGVSRTSFYRNYSSKEDIILDVEKDILSTCVDALFTPKYENNLYQWFYDIFEKIKENTYVFDLICVAGMDNILFSNAPDLLAEHFNITDNVKKYHFTALFGGLKDVMLSWFKNDMPESLDDMARICEDMFKPFVAMEKELLNN